MRKLLLSLMLVSGFGTAFATGAKCSGHFVNPLTDVCWSCILPITIGSTAVMNNGMPDTPNAGMPVCMCPAPPPVFERFGIAVGYWEPAAITDVTRVPFCMVNMGFSMDMGYKEIEVGGKLHHGQQEAGPDSSFYWVHWYKYPLIAWLEIFEDMGCVENESFDLAYLAEIDPMWDDDDLTFILNPEAILFANPIASMACSTEAVATFLGKVLPNDAMFWCAGGQGGMYPLDGNVDYDYSNPSNAVLMTEKMNFKLHREGLMLDSDPSPYGMCYQHAMPILPKSRYRYQFTNPTHAKECFPYTTSTAYHDAMYDEVGAANNYGMLNFRKRNCCVL